MSHCLAEMFSLVGISSPVRTSVTITSLSLYCAFDLVCGIFDDKFVPKADVVIVPFVYEYQRQNTVVNQVCHVDTREGFCDNTLYAKLQGSQCRMLAAGALPVVLPCNDKAAACRLCSCGEFRVAGGQAVICQIRHIGTEGKKLRVGRA